MWLLLYAYNVQIRDTCLFNDLNFASSEDVMFSVILPYVKFVPSFLVQVLNCLHGNSGGL